jgi:hypothetical protein
MRLGLHGVSVALAMGVGLYSIAAVSFLQDMAGRVPQCPHSRHAWSGVFHSDALQVKPASAAPHDARCSQHLGVDQTGAGACGGPGASSAIVTALTLEDTRSAR